MKRRTLILLFILLLILLPGGAALAQSSTTVVPAGETVEEVVLLEGNLVVEEGGTVSGDVAIFSGDATIAGTVLGDVVLFDGELAVAETAVLQGECAVLSGAVANEAAVGPTCTNFEDFAPELSGLLDKVPAILAVPAVPAIPAEPAEPAAPEVPPSFEVEGPSAAGSFFGSMAGTIFRSLLFGVIAFGVATLFPQQLSQVSSTARQKTIASGTVGFLTGLAVPFLMLLLSPILAVLTLVCGLGLLLGMALALGFAAAVALGWFTVGDMLGQRMADWLNWRNRSLPMTTAVGTATLTFTLGLLGAIPFVIGEGLLTFVIVCIGLGAVALTKFGTRPYPVLDDGIRILTPGDNEKVTAVLNTLPEDDIRLK
jgi:hypothetical protein